MTQDSPPAEPPRKRASYEALQLLAFCGLPILLTVYALYFIVRFHALATDFHQEFWPASTRLIHGLSPYTGSWQHINGGVAFPYPALTAVAFVPLALVPHGVADGIFTAINILAALLTLYILGVRDRRIYGLVLVWPVIVDAWQTANLTLVLGLGIAWLWRNRDRPIVAGVIMAVLISLKPFVWPLAVWALATRRYTATAYAVVAGLVLNLVSWALLGFGQLHAYNHTVNEVTAAMYRRGYSVAALALRLGSGHVLAYGIGVALACLIAVACVYTGRRGHDQSSLTLCIALSLAATPVLWTHYFALLIIPLALARPRLCGLWFIPLVMWVCPINPRPWQAITALIVTAVVIGLVVLRPQQGHKTGKALDVGVTETGLPGGVPALAVK